MPTTRTAFGFMDDDALDALLDTHEPKDLLEASDQLKEVMAGDVAGPAANKLLADLNALTSMPLCLRGNPDIPMTEVTDSRECGRDFLNEMEITRLLTPAASLMIPSGCGTLFPDGLSGQIPFPDCPPMLSRADWGKSRPAPEQIGTCGLV
ncbi:MAG: hypothetical protein OXC91_09440 [Rhodobacteraceae bacterium]|nr:hypothetical protein [Paracoccaceae bacterium]